MANLQTSFLAALVLLAVMLQGTEAGPYGANVEDSICCRDYIRHPLPLRVVKYFFWTSDSCRKPGVVLLTLKDREICADPRQAWVKRFLQKLR
ncbi:C-C motif chemokine 22 [Orycteropus afer afer]|uniref:C-C motif chemokine n=1 Tax=Orycteropus afer afer TaxID=1230840 RepID=A0A8B7AJH0_ORYAF|nr:C-C motif chemokine 22 [Orycteropus afer afer]